MYYSYEENAYLPNDEYVLRDVELMSPPVRRQKQETLTKIDEIANSVMILKRDFERHHFTLMEMRGKSDQIEEHLLKHKKSSFNKFLYMFHAASDTVVKARKALMNDTGMDKRDDICYAERCGKLVKKIMQDMEEVYLREHDRYRLQELRNQELMQLLQGQIPRTAPYLASELLRSVRRTLFVDSLKLITIGRGESFLRFRYGVPPPNPTFILREGLLYKFRIEFYVHRCPVPGLRCVQQLIIH
ncbi:unnamed protein product [Heligmosomoides polygyrus]|uniref:Uncharacterized protein n=1 Tax=Heligmosomoides polygyrus TaxID=6339 RepID=A0A3P8CTX5_HELPZ|nr:unnamed protein product [Heligmosomoides polygyrus]